LKRQDTDPASPRNFTPHRFVQHWESLSRPEHDPIYVQGKDTRDEAKSAIRELARNEPKAQAVADLVLMMALDICALLGGRLYPVWPPNPKFRGGWVNVYKDESGAYLAREEQARRAMVRRLERYGVPLHAYTRTKGTSRLDLGRDG